MKCPQCEKEGKKSCVYEGMTYVTAMMGQRWYDENEKLHYHDPNTRTTHYSCSKGHKWTTEAQSKCWCQKKELV